MAAGGGSSPFLDIFKSGANWDVADVRVEEEMSQKMMPRFPYEQLKKGEYHLPR